MSTTKSHRPIDVLLTFDVEDVFSPPELGNDDSIKELADIMTEEGVPAVFLFIGDRAEQLAARGRRDVFEALAGHEIGLHTRSARHPCAPEYVAGRPWEEGVAEALAREREGVEVLHRIFGRPPCAMSAHNVFTSPQAHRVAAQLGLPFVYSYAAAPPHFSISWFCGALCLPAWYGESGEPSPAYGLEWDDVYPDNAAFAAQLGRFDALLDARIAAGDRFLTQLLYHPQRLRLAEFIDHYWSPNGVNLPPARFGEMGRPRSYSTGEVATARSNFRRLVRRIRDDPRLRVWTMRELVNRYGTQPTTISRADLLEAAHAALVAGGPAHHSRFSSAELVVGMAEAVLAWANDGVLPAMVRRLDVLGPPENPVIQPERRHCPWIELLQAAAECRDIAQATGHLPVNFGPMFRRFGVNHLYVALATVLPMLAEGRAPTAVELRRTPRGPPEAEAIGRRFLAIGDGELVDPAMDIDALFRHGRLQTWTLKPATDTPV